jgi:hypothetical protein
MTFKDIFLKKGSGDKTFVLKWLDGFKAIVELEEIIDPNDSNSGFEEVILMIKKVLEPQDFQETPMMSIEISEQFPPVEIRSSRNEILWEADSGETRKPFRTSEMLIPVGAPPTIQNASDAFKQLETQGSLLKIGWDAANAHGYNMLAGNEKIDCEKTIGVLEKKMASLKRLLQADNGGKKEQIIQEAEEIYHLAKKHDPWFRGFTYACKVFIDKLKATR